MGPLLLSFYVKYKFVVIFENYCVSSLSYFFFSGF